MLKADRSLNSVSISRIALCLAILGLSFLLSGAATPAHAFAPTRSLSEMLTPDGTLNLTKGFRGSLDARGWQLVSGSNEPPRFAPQAAPVAAPGNQEWASNFSLRGVSDVVNGIAVDNSGNLYAGGWFTAAGNVTADHVAKWGANGWSALSSGTNAIVEAVATDSSGNVYVGGGFSWAADRRSPKNLSSPLDPQSPQISTNFVAKWNGTSWSSMGSGMDGAVSALAVDGNGNVYAGGQFTAAGGVTANRIAKWNGSSWSAMGNGFADAVRALAVDGNNVYAGGDFTNLCAAGPGCSPGALVNYVAHWNGSAWSALENGVNGAVYGLAVDGSHNLYAGGNFANLCAPAPFCLTGAQVNYAAKWNGSAWSPIGNGFDKAVNALAVDSSNNVYAGGDFSLACDATCNPLTSTTVNYIAKWHGGPWSALGGGMSSSVNALAVDSSNNVYAGGAFGKAGSAYASYIAKWNSSTWSALGSGDAMSNYVLAFARDTSNNVYAGGLFASAGGVTVNGIAKWNGSVWSAMGHGFNDAVWALAVDSSNNVYAGGAFTLACDAICGPASTPVNHIAKWNGSTWSAMDNGLNDLVMALAVDPGNNVYAGGSFTNLCAAGPGCSLGAPVNYVAKWNGSAWFAMGTGFNTFVNALAVDHSNNVYAGGDFTIASTTVNHVAKWNGANWLPLGNGLNSGVYALAVDRSNNLYVGGNFSDTMEGLPLGSIGRWDGTIWRAVGNGFGGAALPTVYALVVDSSNAVYAGGWFTLACDAACAPTTSTTVNYIAMWNGSAWSPLGSGTDAIVRALATRGETLFAGGAFTLAGGKISRYVGSVAIGQTYLPVLQR